MKMSLYEKRELLDISTLKSGAEELKKLTKVDLVIVGGAALQLYGSPRMTGDLDILSPQEIEEMPILRTLSFGGYESETPGGVPTDIIIRDDKWKKLYEGASEHTRRLPGVALPVAIPEYLVAMKMQAGRPKDTLDLEWILGSGISNLEFTKKVVQKYFGEFGVDELDRVIEFVEWQKSRDKNPQVARLRRQLRK